MTSVGSHWCPVGYGYGTGRDAGLGTIPSPRAGIRAPMVVALMLTICLLSFSFSENLGLVAQLIVAFMGVTLFAGIVLTDARLHLPREFLMIFGFIVWALIGMPFALNPAYCRILLTTLVKVVLMAVIIVNVVNGRNAYRWFLISLLVGALVTSVGGLTGAVLGVEYLEGSPSPVRYAGRLYNANGLGQIMVFSMWAAASLYLASRNYAWKMLLIAYEVYAVVVIGLTGSRQAMLGVIVLGLAIYWFALRKTGRGFAGKSAWLVVVVLLLVAFVAYLTTTAMWYRMGKLEDQLFEEDTTYSRVIYYERSFQEFTRHPVAGVGYGSLRFALGMITGKLLANPHNTIIGLAGSTGIIGWMLFFGFWYLAMRRLHRVGKLPLSRTDRALVLCSWGLWAHMGLETFMTDLVESKLMWFTFSANIAYVFWLQRACAARASLQAADEAAT